MGQCSALESVGGGPGDLVLGALGILGITVSSGRKGLLPNERPKLLTVRCFMPIPDLLRRLGKGC